MKINQNKYHGKSKDILAKYSKLQAMRSSMLILQKSMVLYC